jgi:DNA-binding SARP family transcriptional activator
MRFRMLGPLLVRTGAGWTPVAAGQQRVVLAVLLADAGRAVSTERLVDAVWGDRPPRRAVNTVQAYVLRLRRLLGDGVVATRGRGYELVAGRDDIDAGVFERLISAGRRELAAGRAEPGATRLGRALALWRGPVFADVPASPSLTVQVVHLDQLRQAAEEDHVAALLDLGQHAEVVETLNRLAEEAPLRERRWTLLIRALGGCGRRAEALEAFHRARRVLRSELGLEPGPELREAQRAVLTGGGPQAPAAPDAVRQAAAVPAQLPADVAGFTGRATQLERLDAVLPAGDRSETSTEPSTGTAVVISAIAGAAGVGKTALAVHWAHHTRRRFPDGQLYVNLRGHAQAPPMPPLDALARFLRALGVPDDEVPPDLDEASALYRSLLAGKRMLVLLDNAADPGQVRPLLPGSPGNLALVTSRDRLDGLAARDGAVRLILDVLGDGEAADLLAHVLDERVRAEPRAAAELARLCGNLPLALRIAAANLSTRRHTSIAAYAARLAGDRLGGLQVDGDGVRATFDLSYAALPVQARRLFRLLGLVPGPDITAPAAAALAGTDPATVTLALDRLATAHLVDEDAPGRYTMHDLLRHYAAEQAAGEPDAGRRAALDRLYRHYQRKVDAAAVVLYPDVLRAPDTDPDPTGFADGAEAAAWVDAERSNLLTIVLHAAEHGPHPVAWRLVLGLRGYYQSRMSTVEFQALTQAGLAAAEADGDQLALAAAHLSVGLLHGARGRQRDVIESCRRAADHAKRAGWVEGGAAALGNVGGALYLLGEFQAAADHMSRSLAMRRRLGWAAGEASGLDSLGTILYGLGRLELAAEHHAQAVAIFRRLGAATAAARASNGLGVDYHALGRFRDALAVFAPAMAELKAADDRLFLAYTECSAAEVYLDLGDHAKALRHAESARLIAREVDDQTLEAYALGALGSTRLHLGDRRRAVEDHEQALKLACDIGDRFVEVAVTIRLAHDHHAAGHVDRAAELGEEALAAATAGGYRLLEGQAATVLAAALLSRGDPDAAADWAERALAVHADTGHLLGQAQAHLVAARAARITGRDGAAGAYRSAAQALFAELGVHPRAQDAAVLGGGRATSSG